MGGTFYFWGVLDSLEIERGFHTPAVMDGFKKGMALFVFREVIFFFSFFWGWLDSSYSPNLEVGNKWRPEGVEPLDPFTVPLLNTMVLLRRGGTVTLAHASLIKGESMSGSLLASALLGAYFSSLQLMEYIDRSFSITDRVYGNLFFLGTGFHGIHILVGTTYLIVNYFWSLRGLITPSHFVGFELARIYWHFVDVVWIFLYFFFYLSSHSLIRIMGLGLIGLRKTLLVSKQTLSVG